LMKNKMRACAMIQERSYLVIPSIKVKKYSDKIRKVIEHQQWEMVPDVIILDLEDSVPPHRKEEGRALLKESKDVIAELAKCKIKFFVKINNIDTNFYTEDLKALKELEIFNIALAKTESAQEVYEIHKFIKDVFGQGEILPAIETPVGYINFPEILRKTKGLFRRIVFGAGDFSMYIGIMRNYELDILRSAFVNLVITASAFNINVIDSPSRYIPKEIGDENYQKVIREAMWAKKNGAIAKTAIHPLQVVVINKVFSITQDVPWAEKVTKLFGENKDVRSLVNSEIGEYMGTPTYKTAKKILSKAEKEKEE